MAEILLSTKRVTNYGNRRELQKRRLLKTTNLIKEYGKILTQQNNSKRRVDMKVKSTFKITCPLIAGLLERRG